MLVSESGWWRSGRARVRTGGALPCGLGGKSACALADHEGVTAYRSGHVVVPTGKRPALVVVEAQLSLEFLVHSLCLPPLLDDPDDLLLAHPPWHRREHELRRLRFSLGPL